MKDRAQSPTFLLTPDKRSESKLASIYHRAISEGEEVFVLTAYLRRWDIKARLNPACRRFLFVVGTDFGLTRTAACRDVLGWLRSENRGQFLAATRIGGFHPKMVVWKKRGGGHFALIGSSNVTAAGFSSNYEANVLLALDRSEYMELRNWIIGLSESCDPISEDWLDNHYQEARTTSSKGAGLGKKKVSRHSSAAAPFDVVIPTSLPIRAALAARRRQLNGLAETRRELGSLIRGCASGKLSNSRFYDAMMPVWSPARMTGRGFEIKGKHANWREPCQALLRVLSASDREIGFVVREEIDRLVSKGNPLWKAWFSEMLCIHFPDKFPIWNGPVDRFLKRARYKGARGSSKGARYVDIARKLRATTNASAKSLGVRNLAEMDAVLWAMSQQD